MKKETLERITEHFKRKIDDFREKYKIAGESNFNHVLGVVGTPILSCASLLEIIPEYLDDKNTRVGFVDSMIHLERYFNLLENFPDFANEEVNSKYLKEIDSYGLSDEARDERYKSQTHYYIDKAWEKLRN